jgi:hypothetical protein
MTQVPAGPAIIIEEGPREGVHAAIVAMEQRFAWEH